MLDGKAAAYEECVKVVIVVVYAGNSNPSGWQSQLVWKSSFELTLDRR